jgi:hypothetical protein
MEVITGIFDSRQKAEETLRQLRKLGIADNRMGLLTPDKDPKRLESSVPITDTEGSGLGKAMGATVGGAIGAAGGATLGLAVASLAVPGVGPVLAFGILGAAILGGTGAAVGAAVGDSLEEELGEGLPHEDVYLYEDAIRHGRSMIIAYAEEGEQAAKAREIVAQAGTANLDEIRENWWRELRDQEARNYAASGRDFESDELSYRRGFQAAMHPRCRAKTYAEVEKSLRESYNDSELDSAFRRGYERGLSYHYTLLEIHKV